MASDSTGCYDRLKDRDQLRREWQAGNTFNGFEEAPIRFAPTYKV